MVTYFKKQISQHWCCRSWPHVSNQAYLIKHPSPTPTLLLAAVYKCHSTSHIGAERWLLEASRKLLNRPSVFFSYRDWAAEQMNTLMGARMDRWIIALLYESIPTTDWRKICTQHLGSLRLWFGLTVHRHYWSHKIKIWSNLD